MDGDLSERWAPLVLVLVFECMFAAVFLRHALWPWPGLFFFLVTAIALCAGLLEIGEGLNCAEEPQDFNAILSCKKVRSSSARLQCWWELQERGEGLSRQNENVCR